MHITPFQKKNNLKPHDLNNHKQSGEERPHDSWENYHLLTRVN